METYRVERVVGKILGDPTGVRRGLAPQIGAVSFLKA